MMKTASLTDLVRSVVQEKGTEAPWTGEYDDFDEVGTYLCRQCGLALFRSQHKFHSGCGWPSFEEELQGAVQRLADADGRRTEIVCARCHAHLGHVFLGEGFTASNTRHCVNSLSLDFVKDLSVQDTRECIVAAGCFWGVEYYFQKLPGVLKVESGYTGGHVKQPTYEQVCSGNTGHYEAVRVLYDVAKLDDEQVLKYFFEIHDPGQANGQGPDIGEQYLSAIFYEDETQKAISQQLIQALNQKGYEVLTRLLPAQVFWKAENYHQQYYDKTGKQPYCHHYQKKF